MKIAMIGQKGIPALHGGIERHVHELSFRLAKRGFEVFVYGRKWYTGRQNGPIEGVQLIHTPTLHTKHLDAIVSTFFATLHAISQGVDIIHYHGVGPSLLSWIPRVFSPKTFVVSTFHSIDRKHQKWGMFARLSLRLGEWAACHFPHKTISVSRTIYQYARDAYDTETTYIPNATTIPESMGDDTLLKKWGLQKKEYVLVVSRLIPHKGIHYVIDAWKKLQSEYSEQVHNKKLVIVGDGYYTDMYVSSLKNAARGMDSIVFAGFQSGEELKSFFSHALVMVHPSDNEGLPIGVLEGMSYGLPVLVSDIVEHKDLIKNEDYLFTKGDSDSLSFKLLFALTTTDQNRFEEGTRNKALVQKEFSWDSIIFDILSFYCSFDHKKTTARTPKAAQL